MECLILKKKKLNISDGKNHQMTHCKFKIIESIGSEGKEDFQFHQIQCSVNIYFYSIKE
jgi:hypothetical protein